MEGVDSSPKMAHSQSKASKATNELETIHPLTVDLRRVDCCNGDCDGHGDPRRASARGMWTLFVVEKSDDAGGFGMTSCSYRHCHCYGSPLQQFMGDVSNDEARLIR
jgi:hypothetical protein